MEKLPYKECENCKDWNGNIANCMVICPKPIKALKELQQYRQIGTVEECKAARENQIPQNPIMKQYDDMEDEYLCCPNCGEMLTDRIPFDPKTFYFHCLNCGQALKWGD